MKRLLAAAVAASLAIVPAVAMAKHPNDIPPGLAKKPGGMPPGQYKKLYSAGQGASVLSDVLGRHGYYVVRTADAGDSRYVYYRDRAGTVRRATVTPSGDRLRFSSVPAALLQEIHARLY